LELWGQELVWRLREGLEIRDTGEWNVCVYWEKSTLGQANFCLDALVNCIANFWFVYDSLNCALASWAGLLKALLKFCHISQYFNITTNIITSLILRHNPQIFWKVFHGSRNQLMKSRYRVKPNPDVHKSYQPRSLDFLPWETQAAGFPMPFSPKTGSRLEPHELAIS
jgi:hypothetical protein